MLMLFFCFMIWYHQFNLESKSNAIRKSNWLKFEFILNLRFEKRSSRLEAHWQDAVITEYHNISKFLFLKIRKAEKQNTLISLLYPDQETEIYMYPIPFLRDRWLDWHKFRIIEKTYKNLKKMCLYIWLTKFLLNC